MLGPSRPMASVARELIMRGAQDLLANSGDELDQWLTGREATPATRSTSELRQSAATLGPHDPQNPRPLSDALAEMRAEEDR